MMMPSKYEESYTYSLGVRGFAPFWNNAEGHHNPLIIFDSQYLFWILFLWYLFQIFFPPLYIYIFFIFFPF
jgi:hypothetical protein